MPDLRHICSRIIPPRGTQHMMRTLYLAPHTDPSPQLGRPSFARFQRITAPPTPINPHSTWHKLLNKSRRYPTSFHYTSLTPFCLFMYNHATLAPDTITAPMLLPPLCGTHPTPPFYPATFAKSLSGTGRKGARSTNDPAFDG